MIGYADLFLVVLCCLGIFSIGFLCGISLPGETNIFDVSKDTSDIDNSLESVISTSNDCVVKAERLASQFASDGFNVSLVRACVSHMLVMCHNCSSYDSDRLYEIDGSYITDGRRDASYVIEEVIPFVI